jgi:hypothetical protein
VPHGASNLRTKKNEIAGTGVSTRTSQRVKGSQGDRGLCKGLCACVLVWCALRHKYTPTPHTCNTHAHPCSRCLSRTHTNTQRHESTPAHRAQTKKQRHLRYLAAVLCRENSRMLRGATRSRHAGSRSAGLSVRLGAPRLSEPLPVSPASRQPLPRARAPLPLVPPFSKKS